MELIIIGLMILGAVVFAYQLGYGNGEWDTWKKANRVYRYVFDVDNSVDHIEKEQS